MKQTINIIYIVSLAEYIARRFKFHHIPYITKRIEIPPIYHINYITKRIPFPPIDTSSDITKRIQQKSGLLFLP
jgi:hypothetical protein